MTTAYATPTRAGRVARAVAPDNTASMTTQVESATVTTEIDRDTTGGLQSTVDDYVVNLSVAEGVFDAIDTAADAAAVDVVDDAADADTESDIAPTEDSTAAETTTDETT
ncbi:KEOPS complex Pcc1-like subunit [Halonotius pteroides]|uniref:KEOPS complex Pcc1-like subunit n=1 Tax=Halonotius pteroides TaxID=268735 RepID=A0A3A6PYV0_9EURY|nr:KEOPS complex Pcc1-like subunit [Halonotius pteroides]